MPAGNYNFTIEQKSKFLRVLTYKDSSGALVNLTGYTADLKMQNKGAGSTLILLLTTTPDASGNVITLGGVAGTITFLIKSATTTLMNFDQVDYIFRLIDTTGEPVRTIEGEMSLSRSN